MMKSRRKLILAPWVPTPNEAVEEIMKVASVDQEDTVCDLGCGDGRILIAAVKHFGAKRAIGYEIKIELCNLSRQEIRNQDLQQRIEIHEEDLLIADVSEASVITIYLSTKTNELLRKKLEIETNAGTRIVTYGFPMRKWRQRGKRKFTTTVMVISTLSICMLCQRLSRNTIS